ncbi:hypothetical protein E2C01_012562 [Portunus trituberculatus]|uniref:Uncharacterized protein n=1 Tax=Portunus trituberculatus TaxID=210409 RepID=A0A5B7DEJ5_PORTR|nr:hypothetical protein [Portunus trituberculatus]
MRRLLGTSLAAPESSCQPIRKTSWSLASAPDVLRRSMQHLSTCSSPASNHKKLIIPPPPPTTTTTTTTPALYVKC